MHFTCHIAVYEPTVSIGYDSGPCQSDRFLSRHAAGPPALLPEARHLPYTHSPQPYRRFTSSPAPRVDGAASATELAGLAAALAEERAAKKSGLPRSGLGPVHAYTEGIQEGIIRKDPLQAVTVQKLQHLYDELAVAYPAKSPKGGSGITLLDARRAAPDGEPKKAWWSSLFSSRGPDPDDPDAVRGPKIKGLYMFGGVGCGKTMLMDLFGACCPREFMVS